MGTALARPRVLLGSLSSDLKGRRQGGGREKAQSGREEGGSEGPVTGRSHRNEIANPCGFFPCKSCNFMLQGTTK